MGRHRAQPPYPSAGSGAVAQSSQLDTGRLRRRKRGVHGQGVLVAICSTRVFSSRMHPPPCQAQPHSLRLSRLRMPAGRAESTPGPAPQKPEAAAGLLWWAGLSTPEVRGVRRGPFSAAVGLPGWGELHALQGLGTTWASAFLPRTTVEVTWHLPPAVVFLHLRRGPGKFLKMQP